MVDEVTGLLAELAIVLDTNGGDTGACQASYSRQQDQSQVGWGVCCWQGGLEFEEGVEREKGGQERSFSHDLYPIMRDGKGEGHTL